MAINLTVVDENTGEVLVTAPAWNRARQPRWVKMFADTCLTLVTDPEVRPADIQVLLYLIARMDQDNLVTCRPRYIAEDIHRSPASVYASLARLESKGAIQRLGPAALRLSHRVAWRASTLRWAEVRAEQ